LQAVSAIVIDASAILAAILDEAGGDAVFDLLEEAIVSAVNVAEVHTYAAINDLPTEAIDAFFADTGIEIVLFDQDQAMTAGRLASITRKAGLSLSDRSCLALAKSREADVLTADRPWQQVADVLNSRFPGTQLCAVPRARPCRRACAIDIMESVGRLGAQSMTSAVTSNGAATTSPATGTTLTTALVARTGNATTPQPVRLAAMARISTMPSRELCRHKRVTIFDPPFRAGWRHDQFQYGDSQIRFPLGRPSHSKRKRRSRVAFTRQEFLSKTRKTMENSGPDHFTCGRA
jgi:ribonuclease VapC